MTSVLTKRIFTTQPSLARAMVGDCVFTVLLAVLITVGGYGRMVTPAFDFILETGGPFVWSGGLALSAASILICMRVSPRWVRCALSVGSVLHGLFGACFLLSAFNNPHTSFIGALLFFWNAFRLMNQSQTFQAEGGCQDDSRLRP